MDCPGLAPVLCSAAFSLRSFGVQPARLLCPRGFSRQEYWSELPFPSSGHLPNPRDRTKVCCIAGGFFTHRATREAFVNNDWVTAGFICSAAHVVRRCSPGHGLGWRAVCICELHLGSGGTLLPAHCSCVRWVHRERRECSKFATVVDASARRESCYGWCASQERRNFVVPTTPRVCSSQPLSSPFALPWVQGTVRTV